MTTKRQLSQMCRAAARRAVPSASLTVAIVGDGDNAAVSVSFQNFDTTPAEKAAIKTAIAGVFSKLGGVQVNAFAETCTDTPLFSGTAQAAREQQYAPKAAMTNLQLALL